jgi:hypothetical protein
MREDGCTSRDGSSTTTATSCLWPETLLMATHTMSGLLLLLLLLLILALHVTSLSIHESSPLSHCALRLACGNMLQFCTAQ